MASIAQHPAWLLVGVALWAGCELVSGVDNLKVGQGTGGATAGGLGGGHQGSGGTGARNPTSAGVNVGGSGPGVGGMGGTLAVTGGSPTSGTAVAVSNVSGVGPGSSSSTVNPIGSSSTGCFTICGDGTCDAPCENQSNCQMDCGGAVVSSSSSTTVANVSSSGTVAMPNGSSGTQAVGVGSGGFPFP